MFKPIFSAFRTWFKPGVQSFNFAIPTPTQQFQEADNNFNIDPLADNFGNQWIRDANLPNPYSDNDGLDSNNVHGFLTVSTWNYKANTALAYVGEGNPGVGDRKWCGVFQIEAFCGDPAVAWTVAPIYFQILRNFDTSAPPTSGVSVPAFSIPVPRPPESVIMNFGVRAPITGEGIALAFSTTPDVYTASATLGSISVNWAFFQITTT